MKASEIKKGAVVSIDGQTYLVREVQVKTPSSRSGTTLYRMVFRNVLNRQKLEHTYRGEEALEEVDLVRRPVQFLFRDESGATFMDRESFEQYLFDAQAIEAESSYLHEGIEGVQVLMSGDRLLGIELPPAVELEVVECAPAMKAASASARSKPAALATGLVVQVPEYISQGDRVRVNTQTGEYMGRL